MAVICTNATKNIGDTLLQVNVTIKNTSATITIPTGAYINVNINHLPPGGSSDFFYTTTQPMLPGGSIITHSIMVGGGSPWASIPQTWGGIIGEVSVHIWASQSDYDQSKPYLDGQTCAALITINPATYQASIISMSIS